MANVIVTGGSRGLGLSIACKLGAFRPCVIAIARHEGEPLAAAIAQARGAGCGSLHFVSFDLGDLAGIPALIKGIRAEFGSIYGLVNNAGLGTSGLLATMQDGEIERLMRLNVLSPIT